MVPSVLNATIKPTPALAARLAHEVQDVDSEDNKKLASTLWESLKLSLPASDDAWKLLFSTLSNPSESVRRQTGRAIASAIEKRVRASSAVFSTLYNLFVVNVSNLVFLELEN